MNRRASKLVFLLLCTILCSGTIAAQSIDQKRTDGPISLDLGEVFNRAPIKIEDVELAKVPALPRGYAALNNKAYVIKTESVAAGPYTVSFRASSVSDEESFKNLRVFHAEPDKFDPESLVWVDRTASQPTAPEPHFGTRSITARSDDWYAGLYFIGKLVEKIAPSTAVTDLEVVAKGTPESVQLPEKVTFSITVKNNGPDAATDAGAIMDQSRVGGYFVSATPTQGTCKALRTGVYCKLGQLAGGESANIKLVIDPTSDFGERPYESEIRVAASEKDSNLDNNTTTGTVFVLKDPNEPPVVAFGTINHHELYEPGETIHLNATASDPDGSIMKVEFFDRYSEPSLGVGASADAKTFTLSVNGLPNGRHQIFAVATDNGGRTKQAGPLNIFVNGPIKVKIVEPKSKALLAPGSDFTLVAEATHPSGSIKTVEFFHVGISLGKATPVGDNRFELKLHDLHRAFYDLEVVATDASGLVSRSQAVRFTASNPPAVSIVTPSAGTTLTVSPNIEIVLNHKGTAWLNKLEIYANDKLIHEGTASTGQTKTTFTWKDVKPGKYVLRAEVVDDFGLRAESTSVSIVVKKGGRN